MKVTFTNYKKSNNEKFYFLYINNKKLQSKKDQ